MSYKLIQNLTNVNFERGNRGRKYIVIHYTANTTDTAANNAKYFKTTNRGSSAHYFVDKTQVVQVVSDNDTAWAVGVNYGGSLYGQCTNYNSISVEMCSDGGAIAQATINNTVELTKSLMSKYGIPAANVVRHWDVCGKNCPGWNGWGAAGKDASIWNNFKAAIQGNSSNNSDGYIDNIHYAVGTVCRKNMLPEVTNWDDWAGVYGEAIDRFTARCDNTAICYRGWVGNGWTDWVYAGGILGTKGVPIQRIQISAAGKFVTYNAHLCGRPQNEWQGFISGYKDNDKDAGGYRGWPGMAMDGLICVVKYK